jgi:hypothetical protein
VWTSGAAGQLVHGDGRADLPSAGKDGIFLGTGADRRKVSDPSTSGTFTLLGATDAGGDGRLEIFYAWDYGHGWGYAMSLLDQGALRELGRVECGS